MPFSYLTRGEIAAMTKRYTEKDTFQHPKLFAIDPDEVEEIIAQDGNLQRITHTQPEDIKAIIDKLNGFEYKKISTQRQHSGYAYCFNINYKSDKSTVCYLRKDGIIIDNFIYQSDDIDNPDDFNVYFTKDWINKWFPVYPYPSP